MMKPKPLKPLFVLPALRASVCRHQASPVYASITTSCLTPTDSLRLCSTTKKNPKNKNSVWYVRYNENGFLCFSERYFYIRRMCTAGYAKMVEVLLTTRFV